MHPFTADQYLRLDKARAYKAELRKRKAERKRQRPQRDRVTEEQIRLYAEKKRWKKYEKL